MVTFDSLSQDVIEAIVTRELGLVATREGPTKAGLTLTWTQETVALVARHGYDKRYGARPIQRAVESLVVTPLARYLAARPDLRNTRIRAHADDGECIVFQQVAP